mgnify:CR=1
MFPPIDRENKLSCSIIHLLQKITFIIHDIFSEWLAFGDTQVASISYQSCKDIAKKFHTKIYTKQNDALKCTCVFWITPVLRHVFVLCAMYI